jgi:hypothetical protein
VQDQESVSLLASLVRLCPFPRLRLAAALHRGPQKPRRHAVERCSDPTPFAPCSPCSKAKKHSALPKPFTSHALPSAGGATKQVSQPILVCFAGKLAIGLPAKRDLDRVRPGEKAEERLVVEWVDDKEATARLCLLTSSKSASLLLRSLYQFDVLNRFT